MKTISLLLVYLKLFSQSEIDAISILNLKDIYLEDDTCQVLVLNKTDKLLYFHMTIEAQYSGNWKEILYSIDTPNSKSMVFTPLESKSIMEKSFVISDVLADRLASTNKFRLKISYIFQINDTPMKYFSNAFTIEKYYIPPN